MSASTPSTWSRPVSRETTREPATPRNMGVAAGLPPARPARAPAPPAPPVAEPPAAAFARDGYVHLRSTIEPALVARILPEATLLTIRHHAEPQPRRTRLDCGHRTLQARNLWQHSDALRTLTFSRRLAAIAGELLGAAAVQLYSDVVTVTEPGSPEALWHFDAAYLPLDGTTVAVAWIPLQATGGAGTGGLRLRPGSHRFEGNAGLRPERPENLRRFRRALKRAGLPVAAPAVQPGDVVFYSGMTSHALDANRSPRPNAALWITYVRADAPLVRPGNDCQSHERDLYLRGLTVGRPLHTPLHPLLWHR